MKFYLVTDDADTCVGMRFAGVTSALVHDAAEALSALERACGDEQTGILFVTQGVKKMCAEKIAALSSGSRPVVVEIPDSTIGRLSSSASEKLGRSSTLSVLKSSARTGARNSLQLIKSCV